MSLSFKDSLKSVNKNNVTTMQEVVASTNIDNMDVSTASIMTLEENYRIAAYSGDDGNWQQHQSYVRYANFSDDNISTVDDVKDISLNKKQLNITQEENSQYIPFEMPRYYDGFDLVDTAISIHYHTKIGRHGHS